MAQGTRMGGLRRSRSSGLVQTRLLHRLVATALPCMRVAAWLAARPRARTRPSALAGLAAAASSPYARRRVGQRHLVNRGPHTGSAEYSVVLGACPQFFLFR